MRDKLVCLPDFHRTFTNLTKYPIHHLTSIRHEAS
jgi:hypothetical protein